MSNNVKGPEYNRKTNLTYEQFTEAGGILQPIRAIVIKNAKDLPFLFKLCEKNRSDPRSSYSSDHRC